ncbi:zinc-ribbon domain-containing protein [Pontibacter sp. Tf4]|uniref:zinc-ribbon domain-containing protein n=1 Tax=Pontibacter sp. Tf4 TaxID=2761620 RepID=UPI00162A31E9|nr:zinc-ribbon domain-containing protein [Pontibacter sp. Tf4]MBB6609554.1 zinc-ribbon domain-containing protein [Pontibacter sp. Tf4]
MTQTETTAQCASCHAVLPAGAALCPNCGAPVKKNKWYSLKGLNAAEIFLMILGGMMLLVGLVAV